MCGGTSMACTGLSTSARYVMKKLDLSNLPVVLQCLFTYHFLFSFPFYLKCCIFYQEFDYVQLILIQSFLQNFEQIFTLIRVKSFGHILQQKCDFSAFSCYSFLCKYLKTKHHFSPVGMLLALGRVFFSILCKLLLSIHITRIFRSVDNNRS